MTKLNLAKVFDFERICQDKDFVVFTKQKIRGVVYHKQSVPLLSNLHVNRTCKNDEITTSSVNSC